MANNLIGFGSMDGLSGCGCAGSRRAGMAGFGAGPDGLGAVSGMGLIAGAAVTAMALTAVVGGTFGYLVGGAVGKRSKAGNAATGAMAGAATAAAASVLWTWMQNRPIHPTEDTSPPPMTASATPTSTTQTA